ncbi:PRC-barrel domain-containing protein [Rhizorhapis sp. SPR117]|uniref:PRC-barrel domain-containing protein n=1 Tax=Rhizorhapis sp. SPR117 TaxID=2912611 RepID=UPI001F489F35|nr:PRC-barrel domain-containing protein [Rhizorhapis sp. SPR117]
MRKILICAALFGVSVPVLAQPAASENAAQRGMTVRDSSGVRLGNVTRVMPDGSVQVILNQRFVVIPANTLTVDDRQVTTSLSKREISKLR